MITHYQSRKRQAQTLLSLPAADLPLRRFYVTAIKTCLLCFGSFKEPYLLSSPNKTHHSPAQNLKALHPDLQALHHWASAPLHAVHPPNEELNKTLHPCSHLSVFRFSFPPRRLLPRSPCGHDQLALRSNSTSCNTTSQLQHPSQVLPHLTSPSAYCSMKLVLSHLPLLPLKCGSVRASTVDT